MIDDHDRDATGPSMAAANDNAATTDTPLDPRIRAIARAIGSLIARELFSAANDNSPIRREEK